MSPLMRLAANYCTLQIRIEAKSNGTILSLLAIAKRKTEYFGIIMPT